MTRLLRDDDGRVMNEGCGWVYVIRDDSSSDFCYVPSRLWAIWVLVLPISFDPSSILQDN